MRDEQWSRGEGGGLRDEGGDVREVGLRRWSEGGGVRDEV